MEETFEKKRERMVNEQIKARGVTDERILSAFYKIPRHLFVDEKEKSAAYSDHPLPIGYNQTISQPYMVAIMTSYLNLTGRERVLEVGTGSGYQAAILSLLASEVYTIEKIESLAEKAASILKELGITNVHINVGDGSLGLPKDAPFDRIIVTAGSPDIPLPLIEQLEIGGIIVIPVGNRYMQELIVAKKKENELIKKQQEGCIFVPLLGRYGWS
ncbi:MAG: protein-L-isoaspartate(D-aspartate) O-methyltransferase [bacterium]|nr:protein-L-isoaspartate(D-aspartate) O-methyltransferase [bacterium]